MSLKGIKNPYWTDEEFEFWRDHMAIEGSVALWWNVPTACGHTQGSGERDVYPDVANSELIIVCVEGCVNHYPVLRKMQAWPVIREGAPL